MTAYKTTFYECVCGYKSIHAGNASWHKKKCSQEMRSANKEFVLKDDCYSKENDTTIIKTSVLTEEREQNTRLISRLNNTIQNLKKSLEAMNGKVQRAIASMSKTAYIADDEIENIFGDMVKDGIIYFITDKDVPDRGKIGRTVNTDIRKLKSRYSIFGNPEVLCYFSNDINADENTLKKMLREAGCMKSNTEMIYNVSLAREVFYEFIET